MRQILIVSIVGTFLMATTSLPAQLVIDEGRALWIGVSAGMGSYSGEDDQTGERDLSTSGFEPGGFLTFQQHSHYFTLLRTGFHSDFRNATCTALLYGRATGPGTGAIAVAAGPSLIHSSSWDGTRTVEDGSALGVAGALHLSLSTNPLQVGLRGLAWFDGDRSYVGVSFTAALGGNGGAP